MRRAAACAALLLAGCGTAAPQAAAERPDAALLTALPLLWGEADIDELLAGGGGRAPALALMEKRVALHPVDAATPESLAPYRLLVAAQPAVPTPAQLVALDAWVRGGGRLLLLADPLLAWESRHALGDPRRPPPFVPVAPLLAHWGVRIEGGDAGAIRIAGIARPTRAAGVAESDGRSCRAEEGLLRCRIGRGEALIVPDADLIDAESAGAGLPATVDALVDLLLGAERNVKPPDPAQLSRSSP